MTLERCWMLAKEWYADRGSPGWQPKTANEVEAIFKRVGLEGDFWEIREGDAHKT